MNYIFMMPSVFYLYTTINVKFLLRSFCYTFVSLLATDLVSQVRNFFIESLKIEYFYQLVLQLCMNILITAFHMMDNIGFGVLTDTIDKLIWSFRYIHYIYVDVSSCVCVLVFVCGESCVVSGSFVRICSSQSTYTIPLLKLHHPFFQPQGVGLGCR